jgi:hypothetical protein
MARWIRLHRGSCPGRTREGFPRNLGESRFFIDDSPVGTPDHQSPAPEAASRSDDAAERKNRILDGSRRRANEATGGSGIAQHLSSTDEAGEPRPKGPCGGKADAGA